MALDVPLAVLNRFDCEKCEPNYPEVAEALYSINNAKELDDFVKIVVDNADPMKEKRNEVKSRYITNFDGKNGQRIKEFIVNEYTKKTSEGALSVEDNDNLAINNTEKLVEPEVANNIDSADELGGDEV
jgi:hypothetical protein